MAYHIGCISVEVWSHRPLFR